MTKRMSIPDNKLNIVVPELQDTDLKTCKQIYPEFESETRITSWPTGHSEEMSLYPVSPRALASVRKAAEIIATYFKRECDYDFVGYRANEITDKRDRIFLLVKWQSWWRCYAVGAIAFRWREYTDAPHQLALSWVWIHPYLRRQGILTTYWKVFRKLYGDFRVEEPYSHAMHAFLTKNAYLTPDQQ